MTLAPWRGRIARPKQAIGIHAHALSPQPVSWRRRRHGFRVGAGVGLVWGAARTDERLFVAAEGDADGDRGGGVAEGRDVHAFHVGDESVCGGGLEEEDDEGDKGVEEEYCEAEDDEDEEDVEFLGDGVGREGEAEVCGGAG